MPSALWLTALFLVFGCGGGTVTASGPIAPDPFAERLEGPHADLDAYCAAYSRTSSSARCSTEPGHADGPEHARGDGSVLEAQIVARGDDEGFMECALAVRTERGWFVGKTAPICANTGTSRIRLEVEAFEVRGPRVAVRWTEVDSHSFDADQGWMLEESRRRERVTCAVGADGVPACSFDVRSRSHLTEKL